LREAIDSSGDPVTVANLPSRAAEAVRALGLGIQREITKKAAQRPAKPTDGATQEAPPPDTGGAEPPHKPDPVRQARKVRPQDVAFVTVVHDLKEWDALRDKLDERVRELIRQGYDVDLG
jgi:hypothetical protein